MTALEEEQLPGGTVARPVRVGDTVRRPVQRWSPAVWGLLEHLDAVGFDGAPRFRGLDEQGREVLSFLPGTTALRPWPSALLTEQGLAALGHLLRRYHDAVASYQPPAGAEWWIGTRGLATGEIIIHGDLGPWNTIPVPTSAGFGRAPPAPPCPGPAPPGSCRHGRPRRRHRGLHIT